MSVLALKTQLFALAFVTIASCTIFLLKNSLFIEILKQAESFDANMKQLGIKITYTKYFRQSLFYMCFTWIPIYTDFSADRSVLFKITILFGFVYPIVIRCYIIYIYQMVQMVAFTRIKQLNKFLEDNEQEDIIFTRRIPSDILSIATKIHNQLITALNLSTECFSEILLLNIIFNFIQFVFALYEIFTGLSTEMTLLEYASGCLFYNAQMIVTYILAFLIKKEVSLIILALSNLNK